MPFGLEQSSVPDPLSGALNPIDSSTFSDYMDKNTPASLSPPDTSSLDDTRELTKKERKMANLAAAFGAGLKARVEMSTPTTHPLLPPIDYGSGELTGSSDPYPDFEGKYLVRQTDPPKYWFDVMGAPAGYPEPTDEYKKWFKSKYQGLLVQDDKKRKAYPVWQTNPPKFWFDMPNARPVSQDYKDAYRQQYWWDKGNQGPAPSWDRQF